MSATPGVAIIDDKRKTMNIMILGAGNMARGIGTLERMASWRKGMLAYEPGF